LGFRSCSSSSASRSCAWRARAWCALRRGGARRAHAPPIRSRPLSTAHAPSAQALANLEATKRPVVSAVQHRTLDGVDSPIESTSVARAVARGEHSHRLLRALDSILDEVADPDTLPPSAARYLRQQLAQHTTALVEPPIIAEHSANDGMARQAPSRPTALLPMAQPLAGHRVTYAVPPPPSPPHAYPARSPHVPRATPAATAPKAVAASLSLPPPPTHGTDATASPLGKLKSALAITKLLQARLGKVCAPPPKDPPATPKPPTRPRRPIGLLALRPAKRPRH
jgi:hypothetical protein